MRLLVKRDRFHEVGGVREALADRLGMWYHYHATISLLAAALPHLVAGGWGLVAGCWLQDLRKHGLVKGLGSSAGVGETRKGYKRARPDC